MVLCVDGLVDNADWAASHGRSTFLPPCPPTVCDGLAALWGRTWIHIILCIFGVVVGSRAGVFAARLRSGRGSARGSGDRFTLRLLFPPKPIRTISGFLELISRFEFEFRRRGNFF